MNRDNLVAPLVMGLVGLCCFPLALVSGGWGLFALLAAQREQRPVNPLSFACLGLCVLSIFTHAGFAIFGAKLDAERKEKANAVSSALKGRIEGESLEKDAACGLAEEWLLREKMLDAVTCPGEWTPGTVARLEVEAKTGAAVQKSTFCFARAHRWYVLLVPADGKCPEAPPPPLVETTPIQEEEENLLRHAASEARAKALVARFTQSIDRVRASVEGATHAEKKCSFTKDVKAPHVDLDALPGKKGDLPVWKMLSHIDVLRALDRQVTAELRAEEIDKLYAAGGVLVVFASEDVKDLPVAKGSSFTSGEFSGWLTVVELSSGALLCESALDFENSESVGGGVRLKYAPKKSTQELADDDFEDHFKDAAKAAATKMSDGKLTLRLGLLD